VAGFQVTRLIVCADMADILMLIHGLDDLQLIYKMNKHSNHIDPDKIALHLSWILSCCRMLLDQGWATCGIWRPGLIYFGQIASRTPSHDSYLAQKLLTMSLISAHPLCSPEHTRMVSHREVGPAHVTKHLIMTSPRDAISVNTLTSYPLPRP